VFYTPDAVVSFIVRSVDHILRTEFDCPDGLADTGTMGWKGQEVPKVQILDPATGTGTFLQYAIQVIWDTFYQKHKKLSASERKEKWNRYVSEHLLPRLHGFELMMAPYTIAHMKLGLKLKETGYEFGSDERLRVYLTNALQPAHEVPRTETPALAHEVEQASVVKTKNQLRLF
jgi:predicted helicase